MYKKSELILIILIAVNIFNANSYYNFFSTYSKNVFPFNPEDSEIINALKYLSDKQNEDGSIGGFTVSAWAAIAISSAGKEPYKWGNLILYLKEKTKLLDPEKATDWERQLLAIVACNENPRDFADIDFVDKIKDFFDGNQIGSTGILYDDCFGIIALISAGVDKNDTIIQTTKSYIMGRQESNGGWGDGDSTAAAIMALISAGEDKDSAVIAGAVSFLKALQTNDGGFRSFQSTNSAATSWIIMALTACGRNPTDEEWEKNGNNPVDYLIDLQQDDGSFNWDKNSSINPDWMTCYVIPALLGKYYPVKIIDKSMFNRPPASPEIISGPSTGNTGISYKYFLRANDPDDDKIQYRFDWDSSGYHEYSKWTGFVKSGETKSLSHVWGKSGIYEIKAQVKDQYGKTSDWSDAMNVQIFDEIFTWTGSIRIEDMNKTIVDGTITVSDLYITTMNVVNSTFESHYIASPNILGALEVASDNFGFSYLVDYSPIDDSYTLKSIDDTSGFWSNWINNKKISPDEIDYKLTSADNDIIIGYSESSNVHILNIKVEESENNNGKIIIVKVFDENENPVKNAFVYINSDKYKTNEKGTINVSAHAGGKYLLYAEKNNYIRSGKVSIELKNDISISKPKKKSLYIQNLYINGNFNNIWVFGPLDILVDTSVDVTKVEYYVNGELKFTDDEYPFEYVLNEKSFFEKKTITVKSYIFKDISGEILIIIKKYIQLLNSNGMRIIPDFLNDLSYGFKAYYILDGDVDKIDVIFINLFPKFHELKLFYQ